MADVHDRQVQKSDGKKKKRERVSSESQKPLMMDDVSAPLLILETRSNKSGSESVFKKMKRRLSMGSKDGKQPSSTPSRPSTATRHRRSASDAPVLLKDDARDVVIPQLVKPVYNVFANAPPLLLSPELDETHFTPKNVYLNLIAEMRSANQEQFEMIEAHHTDSLIKIASDIREVKMHVRDVMQAIHAVSTKQHFTLDKYGNYVAHPQEPVRRDVIDEDPGCFSGICSFFS